MVLLPLLFNLLAVSTETLVSNFLATFALPAMLLLFRRRVNSLSSLPPLDPSTAAVLVKDITNAHTLLWDALRDVPLRTARMDIAGIAGVCSCNLELIRRVQTRIGTFQRPPVQARVFQELFVGVTSTNGEQWRRSRNAVGRTLNSSLVYTTFTPGMLQVAVAFEQRWRLLLGGCDSCEVDLHFEMARLALEIFLVAVLQQPPSALLDTDGNERQLYMERVVRAFMSDFRSFWDRFRRANHPTWRSAELRTERDRLDDEQHAIAVNFCQELRESAAGSIFVRRLEERSSTDTSESRRLTDDEVLGNIYNVISASHETSSDLLSWALYEVSRCADTQARLISEACAFSGKVHNGRSVLEELPFAQAVIHEVSVYKRKIPICMGHGDEQELLNRHLDCTTLCQ